MNIGIIGGGAAGMMAAWSAAQHHPEAKVILLERNAILGQKVLISGGGRCNVTTGQTDRALILDCYPRGAKFLASAMHQMSPEAVMDFFESRGVPLKIEKDLRVFPKSNSGKDIVAVFLKEFSRLKVEVRLRSQVVGLAKNPKRDVFSIELKDGKTLEFDRLILSCGGQAYRHTGSQGDGYSFAEALGHHVTDLAPSLNAFVLKETWAKDLAGVSLAKVKLSARTDQSHSHTAGLLFTHKGITGPAVFALSSKVAFTHYDPTNPLRIFMNFFPDYSREVWLQEMQERAKAHPKMTVLNLISQGFVQSLAEAALREVKVESRTPAATVSEKQWDKLISWLMQAPVHAIGRSAGEEFVTAGGVELSEVDPKTMQSKLCPGLYVTGELLNIDGFTGGFNLQAAWATGFVSGQSK